MIKLSFAASIIIFLLFSSCEEKTKDKEIIILAGCDNIEITSDLKISAEGVLRYAKSKNIKVIVLKNTKECGYILKNGNKEKKIKSVLTDVDLLKSCEEFFKDS